MFRTFCFHLLHKRMYRFTFLILLVFFGFRGSEVSRQTHTLEWSLKTLALTEKPSRYLGFEGGIYSDSSPFLPLFVKTFSVQKGESVDFELLHPVYREWTGSEGIDPAAEIPSEIELQTSRRVSQGEEFLELRFVPLIKKDGKIFLLTGFELKVLPRQNQLATTAAAYSWKTASALQSGKWVKIKTTKKGIHKITYEKLRSWGFTAPQQVNVFGAGGLQLDESLNQTPVDDLVKNRTWHGKDAAGNDCLFFYATGNITWKWDPSAKVFRHTTNVYTNSAFYFLSQEGGGAFTVEKLPQTETAVTHTVQAYNDYLHYEVEQYNLIRSGKQWFGEKFFPNNSRNFSLVCKNPVAGKSAQLIVNAAGRSENISAFDVSINQSKAGSLVFSPVEMGSNTTWFANEQQKMFSSSLSGENLAVSLTYSAAGTLSEAWLDYLEVNWRRQLKQEGDELYFRDAETVGATSVVEFRIENAVAGARVFDVTHPTAVAEIPVTIQNSTALFRRPATELREYVIFKPTGNFTEPELVGEVANQNLHGLEVPELLIITHPDFVKSAGDIAGFHREYDGMDAQVVTTTEVYNEFGSGSPDATALRNFIRMCYERSNKLKYVLLFGDGSFDNRNLQGHNRNFVPTFQSDNSLLPTLSFVTDDYYVILDPGESVYDGTVDLGIGRIPASTKFEAQTVVDKILNYHTASAMGDWRNILCFIGDDGDNTLHMTDSERLANQVNADHREFQTDKIYFDAYPASNTSAGKRYPGVNEAINNRVKEGVLILNYVGHANDRFLADEHVLDISDINAWNNKNKLPIFVTATCEFSRFDAESSSAGEYILFNPNGGGVALFSTTRVVFAYSNYLLSNNFYRYVFEKNATGEPYRMGDIMRLAKVATINTLNQRNFTLLADPALKISYPKHRVVTKTINQKVAGAAADTLKALNKITITGEITDQLGNKLTNFNGKIIPVVYDKAQLQETMGNGGQEKMFFKVQDNIIYKGLASVKKGEFEFSFVVPKDISYSLGKGKILYYAEDGLQDANGAFEEFFIGGTSGTQISDNKGPALELYLDDTDFRSGDETSQNPLLLAFISDENGINTVGTGIGHDITAVLDNDYSNVMVLNDYYQADMDDYTRGTVRFPLRNLAVGEHSLKVKVWDVANNSAETEIKFVVTGDFFISEVGNYPNPVSQYTYFHFSHNQPDGVFRTMLEIFDRNGSLIDRLQTTVSSSGKNSTPLRWDMDDRGIRIRNGLYLYRITIRSADGKLASKAGKMVVVR